MEIVCVIVLDFWEPIGVFVDNARNWYLAKSIVSIEPLDDDTPASIYDSKFANIQNYESFKLTTEEYVIALITFNNYDIYDVEKIFSCADGLEYFRGQFVFY